jgi:hypothetical protein
VNLAELLQAIADAIREKKNSVESINAQNFPKEILELSIGDSDSVNYVKVIWNEDDTISFVDTDGITHLMDCKYEDDKITEVIYNNEKIGINYKNDDLILINDTEIDLSKLKIESYIEQYTSITYKEDDTIELLDTDGVTHTMTYIYDGDKIDIINYDGKKIKLGYIEGTNRLNRIGNTEINLDALFTTVLGILEFAYNYDVGVYVTITPVANLSFDVRKTYNIKIDDTVYKTHISAEGQGSSDCRDDSFIICQIMDNTLILAVNSNEDMTGTHNVEIYELADKMPDYRLLIYNRSINNVPEGQMLFSYNNLDMSISSVAVTDEDGNVYNHTGSRDYTSYISGFINNEIFHYTGDNIFYDTITNKKEITIAINFTDGTSQTLEFAKPDFEFVNNSGETVYGYGYNFIDNEAMYKTSDG